VEVSVAIFEFGSGGHFPYYLRILLEHWRDARAGGRLHAVVTDRMVRQNANLFEDLVGGDGSSVTWSTTSPEEEQILDEGRLVASAGATANKQPFAAATTGAHFAWSLVCKYGSLLQPRHVLLPSLDDFILPLAAGLTGPVDFSGIVLRPVFHYLEALAPSTPALGRSMTLIERLYGRLFQHPQLRSTFFLDHAAMLSLEGKVRTQICYVPDPVRIPRNRPSRAETAEIRRSNGVPEGRTLLLLFGDISERKGLQNLLAAVAQLDRADAARTCLAIVGKASQGVENRIQASMATLQRQSPIAIVRHPGYIDDRAAEAWFNAADVVLAPYLNHYATSGVQLHAAAHGRPIISPDYGPMGALTRENGLGLTCDPTDVTELASAIRASLLPAAVPGWDLQRAAQFARTHSHEKFSAEIFSKIGRFMEE
jgi:glycosyltransferase involved in cell wall biosynthesis